LYPEEFIQECSFVDFDVYENQGHRDMPFVPAAKRNWFRENGFREHAKHRNNLSNFWLKGQKEAEEFLASEEVEIFHWNEDFAYASIPEGMLVWSNGVKEVNIVTVELFYNPWRESWSWTKGDDEPLRQQHLNRSAQDRPWMSYDLP
jgi:hypothetical protein